MVVVEIRVTCQALYRYVVAGNPASVAFVERAIVQSEQRAPTYRDPQGVPRSALAQFSRFAEQQVRASATAGTTKPVADLIASECDATQDYDQPILRPDR